MTDEQARRALADRVKSTVIDGSASIAFAAYAGRAEQAGNAARDVATAASAVVLASDLRAPWAPSNPAADFAAAAGVAEREEPSTFEAVQAVYRQTATVLTDVPAMSHGVGAIAPTVSPNRQGWRARLANVERLLNDAVLDHDGARLFDAIAEVRAMLEGE